MGSFREDVDTGEDAVNGSISEMLSTLELFLAVNHARDLFFALRCEMVGLPLERHARSSEHLQRQG